MDKNATKSESNQNNWNGPENQGNNNEIIIKRKKSKKNRKKTDLIVDNLNSLHLNDNHFISNNINQNLNDESIVQGNETQNGVINENATKSSKKNRRKRKVTIETLEQSSENNNLVNNSNNDDTRTSEQFIENNKEIYTNEAIDEINNNYMDEKILNSNENNIQNEINNSKLNTNYNEIELNQEEINESLNNKIENIVLDEIKDSHSLEFDQLLQNDSHQDVKTNNQIIDVKPNIELIHDQIPPPREHTISPNGFISKTQDLLLSPKKETIIDPTLIPSLKLYIPFSIKHQSSNRSPKFPMNSLISPQRQHETIGLRIPLQFLGRKYKAEQLLCLNPHLVRKFILENPFILEELLDILYKRMKESIKKKKLMNFEWEKNINHQLLNAYNFYNKTETIESDVNIDEQINSRNKIYNSLGMSNSDFILKNLQDEGTFIYYFKYYMKFINWFNRERQESKSFAIKDIFTDLLNVEIMKEYYFEYLEHCNLNLINNEFDLKQEDSSNHWVNNNIVALLHESLLQSKILQLFSLYNNMEIEFLKKIQIRNFFQPQFLENSFHYYSFLWKTSSYSIVEKEAIRAIENNDLEWLKVLFEPETFKILRSTILISSFERYISNISYLQLIFNTLFPNAPRCLTQFYETNENEEKSYIFSTIDTHQNSCLYISFLLKIGNWIIQNTKFENINSNLFSFVFNCSLDSILQRNEDSNLEMVASLVIRKIIQSSFLVALSPWISNLDSNLFYQLIESHTLLNFEQKMHQRDAFLFYKTLKIILEGIQNKNTIDNCISFLIDVSFENKLHMIRDIVRILVQPQIWSNRNTFEDLMIYFLNELLNLIGNNKEYQQEFNNNLTSTIKDLIWRLNENESSQFKGLTLAIANLYTSPESMILKALQDNDINKASKIFDQYKNVLGEKQKQEYNAAKSLYETEKDGKIQSEDQLLSSFFVINDRSSILEKLNEKYPDKQWISKLLTVSNYGISSENAANIFYSLNYLLPNDTGELNRYLKARILSNEVIDMLLSLDSYFISNEKLNQLNQLLSNILIEKGYLPKMLNYIDKIQKITNEQNISFLKKMPETFILQNVSQGDMQTAFRLCKEYSLNLLTIILSSNNEPLPQSIFDYFDNESKIIGLFLRIYLRENKSEVQWSELYKYCESYFPQCLPWIKHLKFLTMFGSESNQNYLSQNLKNNNDIKLDSISDDLFAIFYKPALTLKDFSEKIEYKSIFQIGDIIFAFEYFKNHLDTWSIDECINALKFFFDSIYSNLSRNRLRSRIKNNPILNEISNMLRKITLVKRIASNETDEWSTIYNLLNNMPNTLVERLISHGSIEFAEEVLQIFEQSIDSHLRHLIRARHAINILENNDETQCLNYFEQFLPDDTFEACQIALQESKSLEYQLFFCQYITSALSSILDTTSKERFSNHYLSLKSLSLLDPQYYNIFYPRLKEKPNLIVENLLMQSKIDEVGIILKSIPQLQNDNLLIAHAVKALAVEKQSDEFWNLQYVWGEDERRDKRIRRWHSFDQAPSIILTKKILSLVNGAGVAGENLLNLSLDISKLPAHHFPSRFEQIQLVDHILDLSKTCFLRDPDGHEFIPTYDTLKNRLELLKKIYNADSNIKVFLPDLSKQSKARRIRDSLMEDDQMELALDVAKICHIEREPVWIEWGLSLLSLGMYSEAREKLRQCSSLPPTQRQQLLGRVIETIRSPSAIKHKNLLLNIEAIQNSQSQLKEAIQQLKNQSPEMIVHISRNDSLFNSSFFVSRSDDNLSNEVRYYCELLGQSQDYLDYLMKQGSFIEAVSHTINNQITPTIFVKAVIVHCHRHGLLRRLYDTVSKSSLSSQSNLLRPYWTAACKYFDQKNAVHLLYDLQAFMKDEARCGLTCIRIYRENLLDSGPLLLAKNHFSKALQLTATANRLVLSAEEIANYMQSTNFQLELFQIPNLIGIIAEKNLDLYGSERKKKKIAKILLQHAPDFAIRIINAYNLPAVKIYTSILQDFALKKRHDLIDAILKKSLLMLRQEDKDEILEALIYTQSQTLQDIKSAEKHISKLSSDTIITRSWLHCQNYKKAYSAATRSGSQTQIQDIQLIYRTLDKLQGNGGKVGLAVKKQCEIWLIKAGVTILSSPSKS